MSRGRRWKAARCALAELRAADSRRDARADYYVDLAERANKEDRGGAGEPMPVLTSKTSTSKPPEADSLTNDINDQEDVERRKDR